MNKEEMIVLLSSFSIEDRKYITEKVNDDQWIKDGYLLSFKEFFKGGTGKATGDKWQTDFINRCKDLSPVVEKTTEYDSLLRKDIAKKLGLFKVNEDSRIEIKLVTIKERYVEGMTGGGAFLQVKPSSADYGLFTVLYYNAALHYFVPYRLISMTPGSANATQGMVPLSTQHRGHLTEGQITCTKTFHKLFFLCKTELSPFMEKLPENLQNFETIIWPDKE